MKVQSLEFGHPSQRSGIRGDHGVTCGRLIALAESVHEGAQASICADLLSGKNVPGALKAAFDKEVKAREVAFNKAHPDYVYSRSGRRTGSDAKPAKAKDAKKPSKPAKAKPTKSKQEKKKAKPA